MNEQVIEAIWGTLATANPTVAQVSIISDFILAFGGNSAYGEIYNLRVNLEGNEYWGYNVTLLLLLLVSHNQEIC